MLQRFVPCPAARAEMLRLVRQRDGRMDMWVVKNRHGYFDPHCMDLNSEHRVGMALEEEESHRRCEIWKVDEEKSRFCSHSDLRLGMKKLPGLSGASVALHGFMTEKGLVNRERLGKACQMMDTINKALVNGARRIREREQSARRWEASRRPDESASKTAALRFAMLEAVAADFVVDQRGNVLLHQVKDCLWLESVRDPLVHDLGHRR
mmetsp:Transcript_20156/g.49522  ORF Transcript_20156/g.49522 Transcript_20156/m.49522 type:complete len:208 (-) Transcript_20156:61-684(-)